MFLKLIFNSNGMLCSDVMGTARTGQGKTLAFLIPVVERIRKFGFKKYNGDYILTSADSYNPDSVRRVCDI